MGLLKISLYFVKQRTEDSSYSAGLKIVYGIFQLLFINTTSTKYKYIYNPSLTHLSSISIKGFSMTLKIPVNQQHTLTDTHKILN